MEVDETFVGGVRRGQGRGRGAPGKAIVVIGVEVLDPAGYGRTRMRVVPSAAGADLLPFLRDTVEPGSHLLTDGHRGYDGAVEAGFQRTAINIAASGDPAHVHLPAVHRVASLLKRWLLGTHQGAVNHDHLQTYLEEFTFRWNRRSSRSRGLLFRRLLEQAVATGPVTAEDVRHGYYRPPTPEPLGVGAVRPAARRRHHRCRPPCRAAYPAARSHPAAAFIVHDPHAADSRGPLIDADTLVSTSDYNCEPSQRPPLVPGPPSRSEPPAPQARPPAHLHPTSCAVGAN